MLFASILGGEGLVTGVALYYTAAGLQQAMETGNTLAVEDEEIDAAIEMLRGMGAPLAGVPEQAIREIVGGLVMAGKEEGELPTDDSLAVFFDDPDEANPTYLRWLEERQLPSPAGTVPTFLRVLPHERTRPPNARETRALTLALDALAQFLGSARAAPGNAAMTRDVPERPHTMRVRVRDGGSGDARPVTVLVSFPPPPEIWPKEYTLQDTSALKPASPTGLTTLYRFHVTFDDTDPPIWRRIELRGDQTLHDLHTAIQRAFGWNDDHPYAFYLNRKAWDTESEYMTPDLGEGRSAAAHRLEHLPLRARKKILYIFDFGDELRHTVTLEAIVRNGILGGEEYPRVTERQGENVAQYSTAEDEDE